MICLSNSPSPWQPNQSFFNEDVTAHCAGAPSPNSSQSLLDDKLKAKLFIFVDEDGRVLAPKICRFDIFNRRHTENPPTVNSFYLSGDVRRCRNELAINFSLGIVNCTSHQEVLLDKGHNWFAVQD